MDQEQTMEKNQTAVEHLTELRKVLLSSIVFFVLCFIASIIAIQQIIPFLTKDHELVMLGPLEVVRFYTRVGGSISLGMSAPFVGYQIRRFVKPAVT